MARNKMEKEFSEKLNQREIPPSAAAWDRLDAMLAAAESQVPVVSVKRNHKWLYIAASFLGFLLIGTLFFRKAETKTGPIENTNNVVESQTPRQTGHSNTNVDTPRVEVAQASDSKTHESKKTEPFQKIKSAGPKVVAQQSQLAAITIHHQSQNPIINQKTNTLITTNPQIASGATADELLAAAQAKHESEATGVKVNARSLLSQVDSQAEEKLTLKQKAMRALNKNYQQVKVAVENRNIEENH